MGTHSFGLSDERPTVVILFCLVLSSIFNYQLLLKELQPSFANVITNPRGKLSATKHISMN
jgi:hypothetical protein